MPRRPGDPLDAPAIVRRPGSPEPLPRASDGRPGPTSFDQTGFRGRLEWGEAGVRTLGPVVGLVVVVDVLSCSTATCLAVERGARVPPEGSSCAVAAVETGAMVVVGCLRNASAVGRLVAAHGGSAVVIAAGEWWPDGSLRPAVEDLIGAGAILAMVDDAVLSPEARAAVGAFRAMRTAIEQPIRECASGRDLIEHGFSADVELAAELDATDRVPVLVDGLFVGGMG